MFAITPLRRPGSAGFTLAETLIATFVTFYVVAAVFAVYMMASAWWGEVRPDIDAERAARAAVSIVIYGFVDSAAGTDTIGSTTYPRRNGLAWAMYDATPPLPHTPTISGTGDNTVKFRLENDTADDAQQFTIGTDPFSGLKGVYRNGTLIRPTLGITDLKFEFYTSGAETYYNIIKITAMVEKDILGTRKEPKHIKVEYSDCAYLRNRL